MSRAERLVWMLVAGLIGNGVADLFGGDWGHRTLLGIVFVLAVRIVLDD